MDTCFLGYGSAVLLQCIWFSIRVLLIDLSNNALNSHLYPYFTDEETEVQKDWGTIHQFCRRPGVGLRSKPALCDIPQKGIHMTFNVPPTHSQLGLFITMKLSFSSLHTSFYSQSPAHFSGHKRDSINDKG